MNDWMTPQQVAKALGVHMNTVKRMSPKELPYYTFGDRGDRKYARADVMAYIEQRMVRWPIK